MLKILFKLILFLSLFFLFGIFVASSVESHRDAKKWDYIYNLDNNIDILFMGSSHIFTALDPNIIDPILNMNSFNLGSNGQMIIQTYFNLVEVLKYRVPKIILIDINCFQRSKTAPTHGYIYQNLSGMKLSSNKINSFYNTINSDEYLDAITLFIKEKYNWKRFKKIKNLFEKDKKTKRSKGFVGKKQKITEQDFSNALLDRLESSKKYPFNNENIDYLNKIINLCKKHNIKIILFRTPTLRKVDLGIELNNYLTNYAIDNEIKFYNFAFFFKEINLSYLDYYDTTHLSKAGSHKVSTYLSNLLLTDFSNLLKN